MGIQLFESTPRVEAGCQTVKYSARSRESLELGTSLSKAKEGNREDRKEKWEITSTCSRRRTLRGCWQCDARCGINVEVAPAFKIYGVYA